jgi:hypothetical protein
LLERIYTGAVGVSREQKESCRWGPLVGGFEGGRTFAPSAGLYDGRPQLKRYWMLITRMFHAGKTKPFETQRHRGHREKELMLSESPLHDN